MQKVLANAGVASRRAIEEMVQQGRVAVNGRVMVDLPVMIDPERDKVTVDDELVKIRSEYGKGAQPPVYIIMNKPKGVYTTNVAQGEQTRAIDLLPPDFKQRVYPVGRLDADSQGLLLLTNDGELTNKLTHPRYGVAKTYRAVMDGFVTGEKIEELKRGVWLADPHKGGFKTSKAHIEVVRRSHQRTTLDITMGESRNRQIRRMLAKVGHKVRDVTRIKFGPMELGTLKPGQSRLVMPRELKALRSAASKSDRDGEREGKTPATTATPARRHEKKNPSS
ncbi:MAG: rRNA pseudouridine synthase [Anaerolineae bacterium]|nr:rRNA pseudouridine synthase [Phycisphaerae bacterium]